ncbi:6-phosphogluconolactonase [Croceicoccus naphthovorans]|uniref:6-phosphogluconolactonase n=1 Tax=Croceicoccus naphthovorans TaxID=1348774 RepID=A0A0G3XJ12_9SPHN|nr:6-phosphogluconolactonase [Croceicoccus naphthovorans]AKM11555.1 6-phosphogluconolactonase [Croceicoccus naphthovorans]MBB3989737.1 6-phosphogluconolactonase [Croceicoccus naphthovorans]
MLTEIAFHHDQTDAQIADWLADRLRRDLGQRDGTVAITVPGGSTPFPIFAELAKHDLIWDRIEIWPGDDRCVPADHEASNYGRLAEALKDTGTKVVPLEEGSQPPHFALAWLGMGTDGHIASLFPNTDPQVDDDRQVRRLTPDPLPPEAPFDRVTMTLPKLLSAESLMFVIRGAEKLALFEAAAKGENDLPVARLLGHARGEVACFA